MRFLNRVHFDSEMYPLELEMYHQIKNVIGVNPQLYEVSAPDLDDAFRRADNIAIRQYMLVIDADTSVATDSLNRLVAACTDDTKIVGICGETKLENENDSWWTMIQGKTDKVEKGVTTQLSLPSLSSQFTSISSHITWPRLSRACSAQ